MSILFPLSVQDIIQKLTPEEIQSFFSPEEIARFNAPVYCTCYYCEKDISSYEAYPSVKEGVGVNCKKCHNRVDGFYYIEQFKNSKAKPLEDPNSNRIVLSRTCPAQLFNGEYELNFSHVKIDISERDASCILRLRKILLVKGLKYIFEPYCGTLTYYEEEFDRDDLAMVSDRNRSVALVVSPNGFWWRGRLNSIHWDTEAFQYETLEVSILPQEELPKYLDYDWGWEESEVVFKNRLAQGR